MKRQLARMLAYSPLLKRGRRLWEQNEHDFDLPLSNVDKVLVGTHVILKDYATGLFPPIFEEQQKAYDGEIGYRHSLPGMDASNVTDIEMRKPFWFGPQVRRSLKSFSRLMSAFERLGIEPPQKILELGCGWGWMAEFLALMKFQVVATTISPHDVGDAQARVKSLEAKHLKVQLEYRVAPMESIDRAVSDRLPFDAVFVYEALHHAFDWRASLQASYYCLKPGGWLVIADEPNALHTCISYRIGKLSNTHEIGLRRSAMRKHLTSVGFRKFVVLRNRVGFFVRPHWIACQK
jgi:protein-L-isoaspartate O-methyltransferase